MAKLTTTEKICRDCSSRLPLEEFYINRKNKDGRGSYCKKCNSKRLLCWSRSNKSKVLANVRRNKYGLESNDFEKMYEQQGGCCKLCGQESKLVIDHCHSTGVVRGLLCYRCNTGLGAFKDDPALFNKAILYIKTVGTLQCQS